jgi:hypothetical protein
MASIVLTTVGTYFGGPVGGAIGNYLGSQIDSAIFGGGGGNTKVPDVLGPRLERLSVQVSSYGKPISRVYGNARIAGNVIWALDIKEEETRTSTTTSSGGGGKGGGGGGGGSVTQTTITYQYYATLAIAICEGEIDNIVRIWADAKILSGEDLQAAAGKYEIFYGDEEQLPSAIMERYQGAGNVPAYRGTAYVVIEDFPLEQYGNRIPNFSFEVERKVKFTPSVEDKVKSVMMIPGSGEFVYSPDVVQKFDVVEDVNGALHQTGEKSPVNQHSYQNKPDVEVSVEQMLDTLPNLEWVGLAVSWHGTSKDAGACEIFPKVEYYETQATTTPLQWSVAGYTRNTAELVLSFSDGSPTYGGTPSDKSVVDICKYLKSKGLNVMLLPFLQVDTTEDIPGEENKPWRGRITPDSSADVDSFFTRTNGYNRFIRHYSQLSVGADALKDYIDAFMIGSEMVALTGYDSGSNTYPAIAHFKTLAANVQTDLGGGPLVSYAADWSEYHSTNGYYNLDPLWTDSNIDFVAIDAYFPITPDLPQSQITEEKIKEYWEKGEGWDYYYTDADARTGLTSYGGDATFAWKNVEHWWNSAHYNPGNVATGWTAKQKPVWFTEYGFPSVDACANQPNVFYDPRSVESFFPRRSRGRIDYQAQREAVNATEDYLEARNAESGNADLIPRRFLWTWDARPFPFFPDLRNTWADYLLYPTGHWVSGKFGGSTLGAIIAELLQLSGLSASDYDVTRLIDTVEGFVIDTQVKCRDAIEMLQSAFLFDVVESEGIIKFVPRGGQSQASISEDELVPLNTGNIREKIEITRAQELDLPNRISISYISRANGFVTSTQISQRQTVKSKDQVDVNLPIVMGDQQAKTIADTRLYSAWIARIAFKLTLPPQYAAVEASDIITVTVNNVPHTMRVTATSMDRAGAQEIMAVAEDVSTYDFYTAPSQSPLNDGQGQNIPETELYLLDLPAFPDDTGNDGILRAALVALGDGWEGASLFRSVDGGENGGNNFNQIAATQSKAIKGIVLDDVGTWGAGNLYDTTNSIEVALIHGELNSVNEQALLNGANACVIGNEIIQFQNATLISDRRYKLTTLLRGRLGTEHEIKEHAPGSTFIFLDGALLNVNVAPASFSLQRHYKAVTIGDAVADTAEQAFAYQGNTLRPYAPVHINGARDGSDNLTISWTRRTRISGQWRDNVDVPLGEETEKYQIDILDGTDVVRTIDDITSPSAIYNAAEQTQDFGSPQGTISIKIYQVSTLYGRGVPGIAEV